jgi:hypothetical protein
MKERIPWGAWLIPVLFGLIGGIVASLVWYKHEASWRLILVGLLSSVLWWTV